MGESTVESTLAQGDTAPVAWAIAAYLRDSKVDRLFGLLGGHVIPIWDAAGQLGLRLIDARDERSAVHMAHAHSQLTGQLGVALVTAGPGLTNAITAIANGWVSRIPLLVITGCPPRPQMGKGALQDLPQIDLVRPITRHAATVTNSADTGAALDQAVAAAFGSQEEPGPVVLEFPTDVLRSLTQITLPKPTQPQLPIPLDSKKLDRAAQLINDARRPLVITGRGAYGAQPQLQQLLDTTGALYLDTQESRGLLPDNHPALVSAVRGEAMRSTDLVIAIGRRFDYQLAYGSQAVFENAPILCIGRFPSELNDHIAEGITLPGDPAVSINQLNSLLTSSCRDEKWIASLRSKHAERRKSLQVRLRKEPLGADGYIHPYRLLGAVRDVTTPDTILVADGGDILSFARIALPNVTYLDPGALGCLGIGVPFATAASIAYPGRPVIAVIGDGSFGFNAIDIDTAARHGATPVFIIANNGAWNIERRDQLNRFGSRTAGSLLAYSDYAAMARAFGLQAERVFEADELGPAIKRALDGAPALLDVLLTRDAISPDGESGLAIVPDLQALTSWDNAERLRHDEKKP